ncbi:glutamate--cysteine ligase [Streptomyces sp. NPDC004647]|uniref:carboxylate-amine ligase n=1 Tax=Streptomyces sp. NPDC004647 TaxID=3154671 RepID=UPI0033B33697
MTSSAVDLMASTLGVEEEFLLVDAAGGHLVPRAAEVLDAVRRTPGRTHGVEFKHELLSSQVEAASGVCRGLDALAAQTRFGRERLAAAAERAGALLISSGTPPLPGERSPVTSGARFREILDLYGGIVADYQVCGCHVHVGVPDRETAVAVVNHLRPWLPTLLALSANSPFHQGRDTGYASWRMVEQSRFPGSGVPPYFASAAAYEDELARLVDCGSLVDARMSFWLARPSLRFPTVEMRAADAAATVEEALLQAALSRALVRTALAALSAGREAPPVREQVAAAAVWSAARYGLRGPAVHPWYERQVPALDLVEALVEQVRPALEETGDLSFVRGQLAELAVCGTGAERQRAAAAGGIGAALRSLAVQTDSSVSHSPPRRRETASAAPSTDAPDRGELP